MTNPRPNDRAVAMAFREYADAGTSNPDGRRAVEWISHRARELDASGGGSEPVAWEILFGKDVPAMMLVQSPDFVRSEARAIKVCELLGGGTTYRAVYAASPADDAGVRDAAAAEALAKMIVRQEALTIKTPEAALHHMAHWRRAIEEGRDLLATLNRVAAEAAASTQEGAR